MKKILYIGDFSEGATSRMRGLKIKDYFSDEYFQAIDTSIPANKTTKVFRSIGWRYKIGPLISNINNYINQIISGNYDLVWVDKAVFITPKTIKRIRELSQLLVHFTPDPAFTFHRSKLFFDHIPSYDYCITTKSFECDQYINAGAKNIILTTQGFDPTIHKKYHDFSEKSGICFLGHFENGRQVIIDEVLKLDIPVYLAGINWKNYVKKKRNNKNLIYLGNYIKGDEYSRVISSCLMGLGLLSDWIPELHTTRTFEIPACGTALLTEKNSETISFYTDKEVIFYNSNEDLIKKIIFYYDHRAELEEISSNGLKKVNEHGYDYGTIITKILNKILD